MSKFILMVLLSFVSCSAMAEWMKIVKSDDLTIYADPTTVRKYGNTVSMWWLYNYKDPQKSPNGMYLSKTGNDEYDCAKEQTRGIVSAGLSAAMGKGEIVFQVDSISKWRQMEAYSSRSSSEYPNVHSLRILIALHPLHEV